MVFLTDGKRAAERMCSMFVVTGASGNTGKVVAERLLAEGKRVRVLARDRARVSALAQRGVEVVVGSLEDSSSLAEALDGAEGLYLLSPPDLQAQNFLRDRAKLLEGVIDTVKRAGVEHTVLLSSLGAQFTQGTGPVLSLHHAEGVLRKTGLSVTFLRAGYFAENWGSVVPVALKDGVLPSFVAADQTLPLVSTPDIGRVAAELLLRGPNGTEIVELVGPSDPTPRQVAQTLSKLIGRDVTLIEVPLAQVVPTFTSFGISEDVARLYQDLFAAIARFEIEPKGQEGAKLVRGVVPLEQTLRALLPA
jgi:uncharacterized protein YbjT (DUF2867 family)